MNKYSLFIVLLSLAGCASIDSNEVAQPIEKKPILLPVEKEVAKKRPFESRVISPPIIEQKEARKKPRTEMPQRVEVLKRVPPVSPPPPRKPQKKAKIVKVNPSLDKPKEVVKPKKVDKPKIDTPKKVQPEIVSRSKNLAKGQAIWYSVQEHGKKTASGEVYDLYDMTAAHASLPLLSKVKVKNTRTGRSVIVTINDRLSMNDNAVIKLSYHAARKLKLLKKQKPTVEIIPVR